ncbi:MAG: MFS transporter [Chloroflexi bacterium]|nr:MFS transporter [Chloroflexota bacterium]
MFNQFRLSRRYPAQLWLLFWGTLAGSVGQSMVWPFLTIHMRERLGVPLTTITLLFTLQSIAGFAATALLGPLMDRTGRKRPMILGSVASGFVLLAAMGADQLWQWAILLPLYGMVNSVFRVGCYAMVADRVEPERRAEVYALLRMGDNTGIAIGPALGGFLIALASFLSYLIAAISQFMLAIFVSVIVRETLAHVPDQRRSAPRPLAGYGLIRRDHTFMNLWGLFILNGVASSMVFVLLGVYVKENFDIAEGRFGFIIGTNAVMVVFLQYSITRRSMSYAPLRVMSSGALFYAAGLVVFALSQGFPVFLLGMVILTIGEMLIVPTGTALVANLAPEDMRARYIGLYTLSFRVASGIGPVLGGFLSEQIAPVATWYGGACVCLTAASGYAMLARRWRKVEQARVLAAGSHPVKNDVSVLSGQEDQAAVG